MNYLNFKVKPVPSKIKTSLCVWYITDGKQVLCYCQTLKEAIETIDMYYV